MAAIVLYLAIALDRRLWRQKAGSALESGATDKNFIGNGCKRQAAAQHGIRDYVHELQIFGSETVSERALIEIHAARDRLGAVPVVVDGVVGCAAKVADVRGLPETESSECFDVLCDRIIELADRARVTETGGESARERVQWRGHQHTACIVSKKSLGVNKIEQLVLDDRSPNVPTVLTALKFGAARISGSLGIIAEESKRLAVNRIGA